jgi:hypothetical protein
MRTLLSSLLGLVILVFAISAPAQSASQFRGYAAIEKILNGRMSSEKNEIRLSNYLDTNLHVLLGSYQAGVYRNGVPIAVNFLLWKIVMSGFASEASKLCQGEGQEHFDPEYLEIVSYLCQWPGSAAKNETALQNFWLVHMGYDAPETEYTAWKEFFLTSDYKDASAGKVIPSMVTAILMNPHFLLRK